MMLLTPYRQTTIKDSAESKRIYVCSLLLSIFSMPFILVYTVWGVKVTTTELLLSLSFFLWVMNRFRRRDENLDLTPLFMPIVLFLGICLLDCFIAFNTFEAFRKTIHLVWLFAIFYFLYHVAEKNRHREIEWILALAVIGGAIISFMGIYQYLYVLEPIDYLIEDRRMRAFATFGQPNGFGNYLVGIIPLSVGLYASQGKNKIRVALLFGLFMMSLALFATWSRGSWIGLLSALGVMMFIAQHKRSRFFLVALSVILLSGCMIFGDVMMQTRDAGREFIARNISQRFTDSQRTLLAQCALAMVIDHPVIGVGPGNYAALLPAYASQDLKESTQWEYDKNRRTWVKNPDKKMDIEITHNMILQIFAELGVVGLIAFLWMMIAYYRSSWILLRNTRTTREHAIRAGCIGSVTAIMISGLFGWPFCHGVQEVLVLSMAISVAPWGIHEVITL